MFKRILLLSIALVTFMTQGLKAQENDYGQNYVKLQFVQPLGEYKDYYNSGFSAEYGRMFQFDIDMAGGLMLPGLDITFIQASINTGKDYVYEENYKTEGGSLWNLGVKIGPMLTFGLAEGLLADVAVQYAPTVMFNFRRGPDEQKVNQTGSIPPYDAQLATAIAFAHRVSLKAGIRYAHFMFGLEFLLGNTNFNYSKNILPAWSQNANNPSEKVYTPNNTKEMGLSTLLLNFGFSF